MAENNNIDPDPMLQTEHLIKHEVYNAYYIHLNKTALVACFGAVYTCHLICA